MSESEYPVRLAGRVIAIDPAGRVLLFFYDDPPPKDKHWATPGGGVEGDEDFYAAARRELAEETGWADVPVAPAEVFEETYVHWLAHCQGLVRQTTISSSGGCRRSGGRWARWRPCTTATGSARHRWWTVAELEATDRRSTRRSWPSWCGRCWRRSGARDPGQLVDELAAR